MLDEEMDHIIRDAVEKHHPAYNDKAWEKMEKKLDKHLPQKEGRRRYLFFLLLFLLLGGGTFVGISYLNKDKHAAGKEIAENKKKEPLKNDNKEDQQPNAQPLTENSATADNTVEAPQSKTSVPAKENDKNNPSLKAVTAAGNNTGKAPGKNAKDQAKTSKAKTNPVKESTGITSLINSNSNTGTKDLPAGRQASDVVSTGKNKRSTIVKKGKSAMRITAPEPDETIVKNENQETKNKAPLQGKTTDKMDLTVTATEPENKETENKELALAELKKDKVVLDEQKKDSVKTNDRDSYRDKKEKEIVKTENKTSSLPDKKKPKKNMAGNFGITFSAGPDLSFITLNKLGKATLAYGAGLSYTFKNRLTIGAGFYADKKIYTASADQYHSAPGMNYYYLTQVNASCKVYEIPFSLSYSFWQRKNHGWFGGAGVSTLLMKSEYYDYLYKTSTGYSYKYSKEINNENKHYFSVLTLSGGYRYHFNKRFSIQAEPYVKLPLTGIGLGKIKLNSGGLLFTATIRPFAKKK